MATTPIVTYALDEVNTPVLTEALEQYAAHREQQTHEPLFAPTVEARIELLEEVARADQLRRAVEDAQSAGYIAVPLDPVTFRMLSAALSSYEYDQMQEAAEATQQHDDLEEGDPARQAAATADRLHLQAFEATELTPHPR